MQPFFRSVRALLLLVVLISLIPALGIIVYSGLQGRQHEIEEAQQKFRVVMNGLAAQHQRVEESTRQLLLTVSQLSEVRDMNLAACDRLLGQLLIQNVIYLNLFIATTDGKVVAAGLPFTPWSIKDRKYFRETVVTKDFSAGEFIMGGASRLPSLPFSCPILDSRGRLKGVIVAGIDLSRYGELFLKAGMSKGTVLTVTDHRGTRLFRYPDPQGFIGKADASDRFRRMAEGPEEGTFTRVNGDGEKILVVYKRFTLRESTVPYLFMSVEIPGKQALAGARRVLLVNLALLGVAFFLAILSAVIIGKAAIVKRLDALVNASRRLGKGDLAARTGLPSRRDELGQLAQAFDVMADELERKEQARQQTEAELKDSEERYRTAIENSNDGIAVMKGELHLYVNRRFVEMFGYDSPDDIVGKPVSLVVHPRNVEYVRSVNARRQRGEAVPKRYDFEGMRKDGTPIYIEVSATSTVYQGNLVALAYLRDVSERRQAEEALRRAEEKYRTIFQNALIGIYRDVGEGRFLDVNPAMARMFGYETPEEMESLARVDETYSDPRAFAKLWSLHKNDDIIEGFEAERFRKDGSKFWTSTHCSAVRDGEGRVVYYQAVVEDITERKKLEDQLRQAQKMEAIGQLAGGVAHDFNNILTVLVGYASLLEKKMDENDPLRLYVNRILASSRKAANLTQSLLAFSRKQRISLEPHRVNDIVRSTGTLLKRLLTEDIELRLILADEDLATLVDITQMDQVLMNLATNARDAMPKGGVLSIETKSATLDEKFVRQHGFGEAGSFAVISISDTGVGMDPSTKGHISSPSSRPRKWGKARASASPRSTAS
jgi:PAS domain S-box-containing protein